MSHLLAIETATDICSVAVADLEGKVLSCFSMSRPRKHAEQLALISQDAMRAAGITREELDAVAVSMGPGSYTGLRIGVSSAKALAMASSSMLIGVPTLEAMAASTTPFARTGDLVLVVQDARRDEVYAWLGRINADSGVEKVAETQACLTADLPEILEEHDASHCWMLGDGIKKSRPQLQHLNGFSISSLPESYPVPSARWVAHRAHVPWKRGEHEDLADFEPLYLKEYTVKRRSSSIFDRLPSKQ